MNFDKSSSKASAKLNSDDMIHGRGRIVINHRYEIKLNEPLPHYDQPPAFAYIAHDLERKLPNLYALIGDPLKPPRISVLNLLKSHTIPYLVDLIDWGYTWWPNEMRTCPIAIFVMHPVETLLQSLQNLDKKLTETQITHLLIKPAFHMLNAMSDVQITHRLINPNKIYWDGKLQKPVIFANNAMNKPAMAQHLAYDPLNSAMALSIARGNGTIKDDLFSLGVVIGVCALGHEPWADKSEKAILEARIETNSYIALFYETGLPSAITEIVRGLVTDETDHQWNLSDVSEWIEGRRSNQRQIYTQKRSRRAIKLFKKSCFSAQSVAWQLAQNWNEAQNIIDLKSVMHWIIHDLADPMLNAKLNKLNTQMQKVTSKEHRLALLINTLLPNGPIIYDWVYARIDGLGTLYSSLFDDAEMHKIIATISQLDLVRNFVYSSSLEGSTKADRFVQTAINAMRHITSQGIGEGPVRALYEFDQDAPCRSPILNREFVVKSDDILPAIEHYLQRGYTFKHFCDRHIIGFLMAHASEKITQHIYLLDSYISQEKTLTDKHSSEAVRQQVNIVNATCKFLLALQNDNNQKASYPYICKWLFTQMEPAIKQYHSQTIQTKLLEVLKTIANHGNIAKMASTFNNKKLIKQDQLGFENAQIAFNKNTEELNELHRAIITRPDSANHIGGHVALTISMVSACLSLVALSFAHFVNI
ncbi:MAG: hypothetical protein AAF403_05560 [Pseudomonadota bacterium]